MNKICKVENALICCDNLRRNFVRVDINHSSFIHYKNFQISIAIQEDIEHVNYILNYR